MRRIARTSLPPRSLTYLARKQVEIDNGGHIQATWDTARRTRTMKAVAQILALMSGKSHRCMFCGDSRSTDIEHFWPKSDYPSRVFRWDNLLWICAGCNRQKGNRFKLDGHHLPLLIDPTAEDPWDSLYFDSQTGNITAKYDPVTCQPSPKGAHTVDPNTLPLNIEAVTEGRQRTRRNLVRAVKAFLTGTASASHSQREVELFEAIRDNDDYGLAHWYFRSEGGTEEPFRTFRNSYNPVWDRIVQTF
jgi:uncharacterized protein (TIGR02646 family)